MKKIIIHLTITSLLNLFGRYYQQQMTPGEYNFDENEDLQVTTKDTTIYLGGKDYYYDNDTLFATVTKNLDEQTKLKFNKSIPLDQIEMIEVEKTDALGTTLTVVGVGVGTFVVVGIIGFIANGFTIYSE